MKGDEMAKGRWGGKQKGESYSTMLKISHELADACKLRASARGLSLRRYLGWVVRTHPDVLGVAASSGAPEVGGGFPVAPVASVAPVAPVASVAPVAPVAPVASSAEDRRAAVLAELGELAAAAPGGLVPISELRARFPSWSDLRWRSELWGLGPAGAGVVRFYKLNDRARATPAGLDAELVHPVSGSRFYYVRPESSAPAAVSVPAASVPIRAELAAELLAEPARKGRGRSRTKAPEVRPEVRRSEERREREGGAAGIGGQNQHAPPRRTDPGPVRGPVALRLWRTAARRALKRQPLTVHALRRAVRSGGISRLDKDRAMLSLGEAGYLRLIPVTSEPAPRGSEVNALWAPDGSGFWRVELGHELPTTGGRSPRLSVKLPAVRA